MEPPTSSGSDFNEAARYAMLLNQAGKSLDLGPSISKGPEGFHLAKEETDEDVIKYYEEDSSQGIDLSRPDAEEHWKAITAGYSKRVTDYGQLLADAGGEIASIPGNLVEGIAEGGLVKGVASTAEGVVRSLRDLWGMAAESENPTSVMFGFKSVIKALMSGKPSQNWREEAQQWNQARKFNYHTMKMMQGDESVLEQYIDMDEDTAKKVRSFINPKVAHAMSFIGMELPSIIAAPFTGGASAELAVSAAGNKAAQAARMANKAGMYSKIGNTLASAASRFDNFAQKVTQRATGATLSGIGKALEIPANIAGAAVGGTIDSLASRTGFSSGYLRNAAETVATDASVALGGVAGGTRQTVGLLGSMGLRTTSELLQEIGNKATMRSFGVVEAGVPTSLTVLESVAANPLLSPSAKVAAKMLNTVVDPVLQLSTASLKHAYKDALTFSFLGYLSDRERGAVGGAAQGMMWGGYSGAIRHGWSLVNGGLSHDIHVKNFDENYLPQVEKVNPKFANLIREVSHYADATKSTRVMSQVRSVAQILWHSLDSADKKNLITHVGDRKGLEALLISEGIDASQLSQFAGADSAGGTFALVKKGKEGLVPVLFLNREKHKFQDFGHEVLGHVISYSLREKGKLGEHLRRYFGDKPDGGIFSDEIIASRAARRRSLERAVVDVSSRLSQDDPNFVKEVNAKAKEIHDGNSGEDGSKAFYLNELNELRLKADYYGPAAFWMSSQPGEDGALTPAAYLVGKKDAQTGQSLGSVKFMFEEGVAGYAESLFIHTNMQNLILPEELKPFRINLERIYNERFARKVTDIEMAGLRAKYGEFAIDDPSNPGLHGRLTIQAEAYDDGVWRRAPEFDQLIQSMVRDATSHDAQAINRLSPAQQLAEAKLHRKEFLFNMTRAGATMKGTKELNDMSTKAAADAFEVFKSLDESLRPEITLDEHGNQSVDMLKIKDEVLDAMEAAGAIDPETARAVKVVRDGYNRWESTGFATSNIFTGTYWGDSQRTIKNGFFQRLFGNDVSVTHRVFVPFEMKLSLKTTDAAGKQLRVPRGGMLMTVVDYMAIHRRKMKLWSRPDVRNTFVSLETYNNAFDEYLVNMMKDAGSRVPSAELFNKRFPGQGEKVRDILYETFGGSIRKDESYINSPREGYSSSHENPNYPIHSMRMELLVGLELTSGKPMPYHHGRSYEGLRRNYSIAGFEKVGLSDNRFINGQGYEVIKTGTKWKVFSPFGGIVGMFTEFAKAAKAVEKDLSKRDLADLMPKPTEIEWADMTKSQRLQYMSEVGRVTHQTYTQRLMESRNNGMKSLASLDPRSDVVWTPRYVGSYSEIVKRLTKNATVRDILDSLNIKELKAWNESNGVEKFDPSIVPIVAAENKDRAFGPRFVENGRFFSVDRNGNSMDGVTGVMSIIIDFDHIEKYGVSEEAKTKMLNYAIESSIEAMSMSMSPYGKNMNYWLPTFNHAPRGKGLVDYHYGFAFALKSLIDNPEKYAQARKQEVGRIQSELKDILGRRTRSSGAMMHVMTGSEEARSILNESSSGDEFIRKMEESGSYNTAEYSTLKSIASAGKENKKWFKENFHAIKEGLIAVMDYVDTALNDESVWIPYPNSEGTTSYAIAFKDVAPSIKIDEALKAIQTSRGDQRNAMFSRMQSILGASLHSIVQLIDKEYLSPDVVANFNNENYLSSRYTLEQLKIANSNPVAIYTNRGTTQVLSSSGVVATAKPGQKAFRSSVYGKTEIASPFAQPVGAMMNEGLAAYGALVASLLMPDSKKLSIKDVEGGLHFRVLDAAILSMNPELEPALSGLASAFEQTQGSPKDRLAYADGLYREVVANGDKNLVGLAQGVYSIERARNPDDRVALYSKSINEGAVTADQLTTRFMDEAVANWMLEMQRYWAVGGENSPINKAFDTIMERKYYAQFGASPAQMKKAKDLVKAVNEAHSIQAKQYESLRSKPKTMNSLADASGLSKEQKEELGKLGLLKKVSIKGVETEIFELSDRDSYVDYSSVGGEPHMLPFADSPDSQKAFSDYVAEVERRFETPGIEMFMPRDQILGRTKLGKVFGHSLLYKYFPWLMDVDVRFVDSHGARAIRNSNGTFIIEIGARALVGEKLGVAFEHDKLRVDTESAKTKYSGSNYITGLFVHEIQHILQRSGNILSDNRAIQGVNGATIRDAFGKLLGIQKEPTYTYLEFKYGVADEKIIQNFVDNPDAPVIASLRLHAKPLMKTATRNMMEFLTFEHTAGRISDELYRKGEALHMEASNIDTIDDAYRVFRSFDKFREDVSGESTRYIAALSDNKEFRVAFGALGLVSSYDDIIKGAPSGRLVAFNKALNYFKQTEYVLDPVERQAFTTQQRRGLSQVELEIKDRILAENSSVLEIVDASMNKAGVRARDLGGTTLMQSIAGIGADASDNPMATALGFMSVVRFVLGKANSELESLGRLIIKQEGWEIDDNGKLVLTTAKYVVKGDRSAVQKAIADRNAANKKAPTLGAQSSQFLGLPESNGTSGQPRTYTIKDFAEIANLVIESEDILSVGNSVIDIINSDRFPPMVMGGEIRAELMKLGVFTEEAAKAVMLDSVDLKMKDMILTKNDLLNVLTFNHITLSSTAVTSGIGGIPDMRNRPISQADFRKLYSGHNVHSEVANAMAAGMGSHTPVLASASEMELGSFKWTANKVKFKLVKPAWCPDSAWGEFLERFDESKFIKSIPKIVVGPEAVSRLNERIRRASLLIKPVIEAAIAKISKDVQEDKGFSKRIYAELLKDMEESTLRIAVGAEVPDMSMLEDGLTNIGYLFENNDVSQTTLISRYGLKASNEAVFGWRGGSKLLNNTSWAPTMLGVLFGPYIHYAPEASSLASADVSEVRRPGANLDPLGANVIVNDGFSTKEQGIYGNVMETPFEELLVHPNKASRSGMYTELKRAFDGSIDDSASTERYLRSVKAEVQSLLSMEPHEIRQDAFDDLNTYLGDSGDFRFQGADISTFSSMSREAIAAFFEPIKADLDERISKLEAQQAFISKVYDVWEDALMASEAADRSVTSKQVSYQYNQEIATFLSDDKYKNRGLSLTGVFGMVAPDGKAIVSLDPDNADITGISSFRIHTSGKGVPIEAVTMYNRTFHNIENSTSHALFNMMMPRQFSLNDAHANPEKFKADLEASVGGFERAEVLVEYIEKYANTSKSVAVSLNEGALSFYIGGNVLAVQSVVGLMMLENPDKNNAGNQQFIQNNVGRIMSLLGQENPEMIRPVISTNKSTVFDSGTAVHVTNATLGAVVMPSLYAKLRTGIPTVTPDGRVMLHSYGFFNDMLPAVTEAIKRGASKEEIALVAKDWVRGIDKNGISMLAHEMSTQMASSQVLTMLGLISGVDYSKRAQLPANYGYSFRSAMNFGAAFGLDHLMGQHSALQQKIDVVGPSYLSREIGRLVESAMSDESDEFWVGMAVAMQAMQDKRSKSQPLAYTGRYNSRPWQARTIHRKDSPILHPGSDDYAEMMVPVYGARFSTYRHDPRITPGISNASWDGVGVYMDTSYGPSPAEKYDATTQRKQWADFNGDNIIEEVQNRSPEPVADAFEGSTTMDAIGASHYAAQEALGHHGMFSQDNDGVFRLKSMSDGGRIYTDVDYVVGSGGSGAISVPSTGTIVKSAIRRKLIANRIASVAKQLGKTEVSIPAARFNLTVAPSPGMMGIRSMDDRRVAWGSRQTYISKVMGRAGSTGMSEQLHAKDYGKIGLSWKRLEDGRIVVNYSPDVSIAATYDILHDSDIQTPAVGIPLFRAIGWDPNAGTAFSQSLVRRSVFGVGKAVGGFEKSHHAFLNTAKSYAGIDEVAVRDYLKGVQRIINGEIYLGGRTHNRMMGNASHQIRKIGTIPADVRAMFVRLAEGDIPSGLDEAIRMAAYADDIMHQMSQDFAYFSFVLPADAKIEDLNTAVLNHYAASASQSGPFSKTRSSPGLFGMNAPFQTDNIGEIARNSAERESHFKMLKVMTESQEAISESNPALQLKGLQQTSATSQGNIVAMMDAIAKSIQSINPNFHGDITAAFNRILGEESGYYLPDSERSLAMYGERSAAIELMFPGRRDLRHYSWDTSESLNLTVFKNAQKRYTIAWNEFGPIGPDGKKQVKRMVRNFDTESEANALADKISAGNIQAEVAKATPNRDSLRIESSGTAKGLSAQVQRTAKFDLESTDGDSPIFAQGKYGVGNIGKVFDTAEAAKAAANLLRQGDVLTMEAPKQERINLSLADMNQTQLENILRQRPVFAIGGSPIQFVSKMVNSIIKGIDKNKRVKEVRTGLEWFDLLMANTVSKNELRATGMAEFLYANKGNNLTKKELLEYLYVFYPHQGRKTWQADYRMLAKDDKGIRNPHNIDFTASKMLYAGRTLKMVQEIFGGLDAELLKANDDVRPAMESALQTLKDMHMAAMTDAYEKVMSKDTMVGIVKELGLEGKDSRVIVEGILKELQKNPDRVLQFSAPMLEAYRMGINSSVAKAKTETLAALSGFQLEIGDPMMMDSTQLTEAGLSLHDWDTAIEEYYGPSVAGQGNLGYYTGPDAGYSGYTSGIGEHVYSALFTEVAPDEGRFKEYIANLEASMKGATDPAEKTKFRSAMDAAKHVYEVRKAIARDHAKSSTSHRGAPRDMGFNLIGHLRVTDATVPTAVPVMSTPGSIFDQLRSYGRERSEQAQIPVAFVEELQSDTYQRKTFGPFAGNEGNEYNLYATFKEIEELPGLRKEFNELTATLEASRMSETSRASFLQGFTGGSAARYVIVNYFIGPYAETEISNSGPFVRYMLSQVSGNTGDWSDSGRKIPVPESLRTNYGLPEFIPDVYPSGPLSENTLLRYRSSVMHPLESIHPEVVKQFMMPNDSAIPGFGNLKFQHIAGLQGNFERSVSGLAKIFLALSPEFIAHARELADASKNDYSAVESFKGKIDFDALARSWADKIRAMATNQDLREEFIRKYGMGDMTKQNFNRFLQLSHILDAMAKIDAGDAAFQVKSPKFDNPNSDWSRRVSINPQEPGFDPKFIDRKQIFAVVSDDDVVTFVNKIGGRLALRPFDKANLKPLLDKYGMRRSKTRKSPRGVVSAMLAFTSDALNGLPQEEIAKVMLEGSDPGFGPKELVDFAHGRTKGNDNKAVLSWLDGIFSEDSDNGFYRKLGNMFRATDYENDPSHISVTSMYDHIQHNANTLMGRMMEAVASGVATVWKTYNEGDDVALLKQRQAEVAKKAGLKVDDDGNLVTYNVPDSIPHGEDNAYRPILVNIYVMNALVKRQRAIVIADARHHRSRYSSNGYVNHAVNLGNGKMFMLNRFDGNEHDLSEHAYILDVVRKRGMLNNLIKRIREQNLVFDDRVIEIEGTSKTLGSWLIQAGHEVIDELPDAFSTERNRERTKTSFARTIEQIARVYKALTLDGMAESFERVGDAEDMKKRMGKMKDAPEGLVVSLPYDKTHGYTVNYGAPGWQNEYYYAGNPRKSIEAVSHDAFEKASIAMANDKTYVVLAPNGKVLFEKIATIEEAEERAAQSSKYLGNVPHLTVFLKQYGRIGAYVMEAFMQSTFGNERHPAYETVQGVNQGTGVRAEGRITPFMDEVKAGSGLGAFSKTDWNIGKYDEALIGPYETDANPSSSLKEGASLLAKERGRHANTDAVGPFSITRGMNSDAPIPVQLHAMGITKLSSSQEVAAGMARIAGFTGPMMVIKPKFPTAMHASEMAKLIVEGVSLMSLADNSRDGKVRAMTEAFNWYRTPKKKEDDESRPVR